jgi:hypothetical protein
MMQVNLVILVVVLVVVVLVVLHPFLVRQVLALFQVRQQGQQLLDVFEHHRELLLLPLPSPFCQTRPKPQ